VLVSPAFHSQVKRSIAEVRAPDALEAAASDRRAGGVLVDRQDDRPLGRGEIEPDDVGRDLMIFSDGPITIALARVAAAR
jgi:hypothetical protein